MVQNGAERGKVGGRVVQGVRFRVHLSGESGQIYSDLLRFGQIWSDLVRCGEEPVKQKAEIEAQRDCGLQTGDCRPLSKTEWVNLVFLGYV